MENSAIKSVEPVTTYTSFPLLDAALDEKEMRWLELAEFADE